VYLLDVLESPQSRRTDHFSIIVADRQFSTGCYLFTVSNAGLLFYTKRLSTTPSQPRPLTDTLWVLTVVQIAAVGGLLQCAL